MNSKLIEGLNAVIASYLKELVVACADAPHKTQVAAAIGPTAYESFILSPLDKTALVHMGAIREQLRIIDEADGTTAAQHTCIKFALIKMEEYISLIEDIEPGQGPIKEADRPKNAPLTGDSDLFIPESVSRQVALDAAWAIDPLCDELLDQIPEANVDSDTMQPCAVMETLVLRIKTLNSVLMSALYGPDITLREAARKVYGPRYAARLNDALEEANQPATEANYMEGVKLALVGLKIGEDIGESDAAEMTSMHRGGAAQNNFALPLIQAIIKKPELAEGFAAMVSCFFAAGTKPAHSELSSLTYFDIHRPLTREEAQALLEEESAEQTAYWNAQAKAEKSAAPTAKKTQKAPSKKAQAAKQTATA